MTHQVIAAWTESGIRDQPCATRWDAFKAGYEAAEARATALEEALKPFAKTADVLGNTKDSAVWAGQQPAPPITFGNLRRARALLTESKADV